MVLSEILVNSLVTFAKVAGHCEEEAEEEDYASEHSEDALLDEVG